jgi:hypothetical protein
MSNEFEIELDMGSSAPKPKSEPKPVKQEPVVEKPAEQPAPQVKQEPVVEKPVKPEPVAEKPVEQPKPQVKPEPVVEKPIEQPKPQVKPEPVVEKPVEQPKPQVVHTPKETAAPSKPEQKYDDLDFGVEPGVGEKLENWAKAGSGIGFWLRIALIGLPCIIILIIIIASFSGSLGKAKKQLSVLEGEKIVIVTENAEYITKIDSLQKSIDTLQTNNQKLQERVNRLTPKPKAAATAKNTAAKKK